MAGIELEPGHGGTGVLMLMCSLGHGGRDIRQAEKARGQQARQLSDTIRSEHCGDPPFRTSCRHDSARSHGGDETHPAERSVRREVELRAYVLDERATRGRQPAQRLTAGL
jgi:hypothetical protein